ncbi:uncharacterized protein EKO05_0010707 [Ascochyta rabiei]|uniref:uncharacterized protein n=1 Tax=Didymella rabiei TaxID=5454 RepID=UPI002204E245|nr:uncharacterized protein EKO05_0010707 [Ascochyta rabiei]UPX20477.1 hypothetical protein EKO05_0010707 [Ascochyta rabiei]
MPTSHDTKKWLHHLWKPASSEGVIPNIEPPRLAPPRPPRPEPGVIRNVNAWLDASMETPLMGGLPYWKAASAVPPITSTDVQYAVPIVRPLTPSSQQVKSFCRRAKKMHAKVSGRQSKSMLSPHEQPQLLTSKPGRTNSLTALAREDSMGDLSEAPTYSSGRPPPSYRSRTASILTTSSFGCVDGMSPAQRQVSQQRAMKCRGVRGRVKELRRRLGGL